MPCAHRVAGKYPNTQIPVEALKGKEVEGTWALYRACLACLNPGCNWGRISLAERVSKSPPSYAVSWQPHFHHPPPDHPIGRKSPLCCCYSALLCCLPLAALLRAPFLSPCPCTRVGTAHRLPSALRYGNPISSQSPGPSVQGCPWMMLGMHVHPSWISQTPSTCCKANPMPAKGSCRLVPRS